MKTGSSICCNYFSSLYTLLLLQPSSIIDRFLSSLIFLKHGRWTILQPACHPPKGYIGRQANHKTVVIWTSPDSRQRSAMCLPMSVTLQDPVRQVSWIYYWLDYYSNRNCKIPGRRNYLPRTIQKKIDQRWIYILPSVNIIQNKSQRVYLEHDLEIIVFIKLFSTSNVVSTLVTYSADL